MGAPNPNLETHIAPEQGNSSVDLAMLGLQGDKDEH